ncbi:hypothetical protein LWI29_034523 [Acer saccharum]|uniref:Uncharacterized protein n=1 Tax=Acer saccharum TaxID=4024 RepID=A0AA39RFW5_ACESA|nr:hypothetical protein LWI29_034523 [Acer saccharum]
MNKGGDGDHQKEKLLLTRLIVDMEFRSQFEVARPTRGYKELINTLPVIFVGTEEKLNKIICLLCPASNQSLKEKGLHIPPWRSDTYMQSKWLSKNFKRVSFSSNNIDQLEDHARETSKELCRTHFLCQCIAPSSPRDIHGSFAGSSVSNGWSSSICNLDLPSRPQELITAVSHVFFQAENRI